MDTVKIELARVVDIHGITRVLETTPLKQDFVYRRFNFERNVDYSFKRSIAHKHEGVYVAKDDTDVAVVFLVKPKDKY
ncbi:MAG TPA: hypothetical protein VJH68_03095 [Candidatus Nanoarchaeia archaeon]|nr:hypothetical protein [Candidatus Nanoarchaeia archaeon]